MLSSKQNKRIASLFTQYLTQSGRTTQNMWSFGIIQKAFCGLAALTLLLSGPCIVPVNAQLASQSDTTVKGNTKAQKNKPPKKTSGKGKSSKTSNVAKRIVVVFPVDAKGPSESLSDIITDVEKARLSVSGQYSGISFLTSLPSVRRSVNEQALTQTDILPPYAMRTKAQRLTMAAGYDVALVSSLDSYEYSADNQNVTMVLTIQMIDFSGATPRNYTAADTVTTPAKSAKNATDTVAAETAARSLAEKLMTSVLNSAMGPKTPAAGTTTPAPK